MKGSPVLEFEPSRGRLSGHSGCNVISGSFHTSSRGKIVTSALASTRMACPGMDKEAAFVAAISETMLNFKIDGTSLRLTSRKGKALVFQKIY
jgi:heat shock protein HslJ